MDYRDRLASTNHHYARLEEDGELVIVISHRDPGVPNWLDASGHAEGFITFRWIGSSVVPRPSVDRVGIDELDRVLGNCCRMKKDGRAAQIAERRRGLLNRIGV